MSNSLLLTAALLLTVILLAIPLGRYMHRVYDGQRFWATRALGGVERGIYWLIGTSPAKEMDWKRYALSLLLFNLIGGIFLYLLLLAQGILPLNPLHFPGVPAGSAFNTAVSFLTNTNWQDYSGGSTMSYLSQMLGLTVQNFLSAATGITILLPVIRAFARHETRDLGNFWVDMTRTVLYVLLPLSVLFALILMEQGTVQTLVGEIQVHLIAPFLSQGKTIAEQTLHVGPVASQEAIMMLGNNGGGFFNMNDAHPFENPTGLTNFLETGAMILIPIALIFLFGHMVKAKRTAWGILVAMLIIFIPLTLVSQHYELAGNSLFHSLGVTQANTAGLAGGGNMEGVEDRIGSGASALFATVATATSTGAANTAYDSLIPISGGINLFLMQLGEVVFGGVGSGLASFIAFMIFAVFLGGLMVGRTPEFLGKKIESFEIKMASLSILVMPLLVLIGTAIAVSTTAGRTGVFNPGPHGFSEMLYAVTSPANNNGSAFGGLSSDTRFYNLLTGFCMLFGRYWVYLPLLAMVGSLAEKKKIPVGSGTLATDTPIFVGLTIGVIFLVGALNFFPALALGPIAEQLAPPPAIIHQVTH
ncbi:potassium-transporting ATPase subunit KdpA [Acidithiobacillus sp. CV18-2]|nr:potassium-transporting ATPase subunit KdpA [Acidithiobacillus sp. CV18-3]MBU2757986.1 potassium-transporting ATPase subunit KdpA [Acidithiobacillus sp. BN09-2]MBU2776640.1 potassium-transporting ATPase subunit KdpA [Acidithiobacillus sp. CV18-2]MBU2798653.1 potassium-transporting ATPase subunit KdpA [Acidithiobacillus sp. VAN18-4]UTV82062.1 potassium-transporting ATPase subunit KdpA [Acidithiobacillus sp. YTS05]